MAVMLWIPSGSPNSEPTPPVKEEILVTVVSAVYDTVTIRDIESGETKTCNTDANGEGIIDLYADTEYEFTSSIAKAIDGSGADYSKTVRVDADTTDVKVMPDGKVVYWYGNTCGYTIDTSTVYYTTSQFVAGGTRSVQTNYIQFQQSARTKSNYMNITGQTTIDMTPFNTAYLIRSIGNNLSTAQNDVSKVNRTVYAVVGNQSGHGTSEGTAGNCFFITSLSNPIPIVGVVGGGETQDGNYTQVVKHYALWLE